MNRKFARCAKLCPPWLWFQPSSPPWRVVVVGDGGPGTSPAPRCATLDLHASPSSATTQLRKVCVRSLLCQLSVGRHPRPTPAPVRRTQVPGIVVSRWRSHSRPPTKRNRVSTHPWRECPSPPRPSGEWLPWAEGFQAVTSN